MLAQTYDRCPTPASCAPSSFLKLVESVAAQLADCGAAAHSENGTDLLQKGYQRFHQ